MEDIWQLRFVFGKMGTGKTGLIAISSIKDMQDPQIKHIYTSVGIPGTIKFDPSEIGKGKTFPPYSSVYIDEFGLLYNSRDFKSFPKQAREFFKFCRQQRIKCTVYSQAPDIDKSVRDLAHSYGLLRRIGPFTIEFDISKNIDIGNDMQGNGQLIDNYFKAGLIGGVHIHYLPRYFNLWNSFDPPLRDLIDGELIDMTPGTFRAMRFNRFYKFNFRIVYEKLLCRVSALQKAVYRALFKNNFFVTRKTFDYLQTLYRELFECDGFYKVGSIIRKE